MGFWEVVVLRKKVFLPEEPFLQKWNKIFLVLSVFALSLDLLFFYEFGIDGHRKCLRLDLNLERAVFIVSSVVGFCLTFRVIFQFRTGFYVSTSSVFGSRMLTEDPLEIAKRYLSSYFVIDILATIPLPQVAILLIIPNMAGPRVLNTINVLKFIVAFQFVPKMFRFYQVYKETLKSSQNHSRIAQFTLFLYICAGNVSGAFWYLFSIEREMDCWEGACGSHVGCSSNNLYCRGYFGNGADTNNRSFLDIACPADLQGRSPFDFGMFIDAHNSGILESTSFLQKFLFSSWWALQNLSTLGQNLKTSKQILEICFAVCIFIGGVVLFSFVIGIIQATMLSSTMRAEKMKIEWQDVEHWMDTYSLPSTLRKRVKRHQQYKWKKIKGLDVENLLHNFPKDLRSDIKRHLCRHLLLTVPFFCEMDEQALDALCDALKPALYTEESYIIREGEPVDEMLFIMRGELLSTTTHGGRPGFFNSVYLKAGNFCGEELLTWALDPNSSQNLPMSNRTVQTQTEVEAFALMADEFKFVASRFSLHNRQIILNTFKYFSVQWMTYAACIIQAAWRRYVKKKLEETRQREEDMLQDELGRTSGNSTSLGATLYASRFAVNALRALRRVGNREARPVERASLPPMFPQKPPEPDFSSKEQ